MEQAFEGASVTFYCPRDLIIEVRFVCKRHVIRFVNNASLPRFYFKEAAAPQLQALLRLSKRVNYSTQVIIARAWRSVRAHSHDFIMLQPRCMVATAYALAPLLGPFTECYLLVSV